MEIAKKQLEEIEKLIFKFNFGFNSIEDGDEEQLFYRISYTYESKNIKKLKYLIENSKRLTWCDDEHYSKYSKKTIEINYNPHKN